MIYDMFDLHLLKYPCGDDCTVGVIRIGAIDDSSLQVNSLVAAIDSPEIKVDLINPSHDVVSHFRTYRPDILMLNAELLGEDYINTLTARLKRSLPRMPFAAVVCGLGYENLFSKYGGFYCMGRVVNPIQKAENIKSLIFNKIVSREFYLTKLRECTVLTLKAMKVDAKNSSFDFLVEAVVQVLINPYVVRTSWHALSGEIAGHFGVSTINVESFAKDQVINAYSKMSDYEKKTVFGKKPFDFMPTPLDFVYAAALIVSKPCMRILHNLDYEPFLKNESGITLF